MLIGANQQLSIYTATAGTRDAEGRKELTYALSETVWGNLFETVSRELVNGVWTQISSMTALLPAGVDVSHKDLIEDTDGVRYRVETVARRRGPNGKVNHTSCVLIRTEA